ncbi:YrvL family regulatory protein [Salimicrobium jeotgali]|uniref:YrvL family regulatory protein n=1 Tax=Salimicrobium jeotgali TaxID=1230341 RepID=UPI000C84BD79|nr:YrvL family regulatory protein [Salimicrobium jeotgali]
MKKKIKNIIGPTLFSLVIVGMIIGIYFLGIVGLFDILGVQYQSSWSLLLFVVSIFILGLPIDLVSGAVADLSVKKLRGKTSVFVVRFLFGFATNWIAIYIVDVFMSSVDLALGTKLVVSLVLTLFEMVVGVGEINSKDK